MQILIGVRYIKAQRLLHALSIQCSQANYFEVEMPVVVEMAGS